MEELHNGNKSLNNELSYPNEKMFEMYGTFEDDKSILSQSEYILIRHGISEYNLFAKNKREEIKHLSPDEKISIEI